MPRTGENIYKRKDGRWEARYLKCKTVSGKACYGYVYGKTYREAKEKRLNAISQSLAINKREIPQCNDTFGDAARKWLTVTEVQIKESSVVKYQYILEKHILPVFQDLCVSELTNERIQDFSIQLLSDGTEQGKGLSSKTVSDILSVLRSILSYAGKQGKKIATDGSGVRIRRTQKPLRVLTRNEQNVLSSYLVKNSDQKNTGILLCLYSGIRVGELCALRWEDISLVEHTIYIHKTMQRIQNREPTVAKTKVIVDEPKSSSSNRLIPIPQEIVAILKTIPCKSGYFLTGTERMIEPRVMQNRFKQILATCHIEHANFHALRHTFATRCIELDFDPKSLSEILGHANVSVTMNLYVHPSMELKRNHMQRLSDLLAVK